MVLIFTFIFMIFGTVWIDDKKSHLKHVLRA